jgi:S1-C subfamily serine protease
MNHRASHTFLGQLAEAHCAAAFVLAAGLFFIPAFCRAGDNAPTSRPILEELNRETRDLFRQTAPSIVRVQLPIAAEAEADDPLNKWAGRLDPDVRRRLEAMQERGPAEVLVREDIVPSTLPSDPTQGDQVPHMIVMQLRPFVPNSMGVVIDDQRHILVPQYVDPERCSGAATVLLPDGTLATATFVGSDDRTQLTVLKLQSGDVKPATLGSDDLSPGTLLMVLSLNPAFNRLAVWQGWQPDAAALVTLDGAVAGFAGANGFMPAAQFRPVAEELIDHGHVRRAYLGVGVREVSLDDPQRQTDPALGQTPALRIVAVVSGSAADKAGLRPGDLILQLAGDSAGDVHTFAASIAKREGPTPIQILRDGQRMSVTVQLEIE